MTPVAMLGLGHMGEPIARNLIKAGFDVRAWSRTLVKAKALEDAGALAADTPADAAAGASVVVSSLLDDDSMLDLLRRRDGLLAGMEPNAVHVCTTTISPDCAIELDRLHAEAGQRFLAAPVIGRPPAARAGTLIALAAGSEDALADATPVLQAFASQIIDPGGGPAAAYTMKLAVNFFVVAMIELFAEAFAFTAKAEIAPEPMAELIGKMLGHPAIAEYLSRVSQARFDEAGFEATTGLKDVRLMLQRSEELGAPLPYAVIIRDRLLAAVDGGLGQQDWSIIGEIARREAGL
jgi:3-hydroxyisobutyrate dehydrogenase-like beta-hydroxyacid dehydrogenase